MIAVSTDSVETLKRFKASLSAPMHFVSDQGEVLVKAYDLKSPVVGWAKRTTFVVGPGRKVLSIQEGSEAMEPSGAIRACALHPESGVKNALTAGSAPAWARDGGQ